MSIILVINGLLAFTLFYLLATSIILVRNRFDLTALSAEKTEIEPKISVCIPARNEEQNIKTLLESLVKQTYKNFEVLVLDDHSDDNTREIVLSFENKHPELIKLHQGEEKPDDWLGKPWACHQLGKKAAGDYLLFIDADTRLYPNALKGVSSSFQKYRTDMLTVWPQQILNSFWEKTVIPLVYYALVTMLPATYVYRDPRWMPDFFQKKFRTAFAAACGQFIAFKTEVYHHIGGHASVKDQIVEDVELAKIIKKSGFTLRMFHGVGSVQCRMYHSEKEIFEGFRKNFFAGFNRSVLLFLSAAVLHLIVFVLPFITLPVAWIYLYQTMFFLSAGSVIIILLHRLILSIWFRWDPLYAFTHPIGVVWFQRLGIKSLIDFFSGSKPKWKGRNL